ncbi:hypothetical protein ACI8EN_025960, partial [Escherichia coli]
LMMNPVPWLQMTNMISYQGLVRTFPNALRMMTDPSVSHQSTITTQSCFSDILSEKQCLFVSVLSPF